MSERNYWDEESLQQYRTDLIQQRNKLNPITDSYYIKFVDKEIENLPDHYLESQVDFNRKKQIYVDDSTKEEKTKPKKRFFNWLRDNVGLIVLSVIVIAILVFNLAGVILSLFASFEPMVEFLTKIGGGYWFVGLIIVPFAIISLIQMYRGAILLINADEDVFGLNDNRKTWKPPLYILINLLGLIALFIFLKRI